jgi:hypothetical protein
MIVGIVLAYSVNKHKTEDRRKQTIDSKQQKTTDSRQQTSDITHKSVG